MTDSLTFTVTFHGPFRVSAGHAGGGLDAVIDRDDPLPGSSLKGLMRDAAAEILGANRDLINRVFGSEFAESPWVWSSAQPTRGGWPATSVRARVSIDEETHSVLEDRIMFAEILEPTVPATFEIHLRGSLMDQERMVHMRLLLCAAAAVKHLGAERRRGLGSVTVQGDREITSDDIAIIRNRGSVDV